MWTVLKQRKNFRNKWERRDVGVVDRVLVVVDARWIWWRLNVRMRRGSSRRHHIYGGQAGFQHRLDARWIFLASSTYSSAWIIKSWEFGRRARPPGNCINPVCLLKTERPSRTRRTRLSRHTVTKYPWLACFRVFTDADQSNEGFSRSSESQRGFSGCRTTYERNWSNFRFTRWLAAVAFREMPIATVPAWPSRQLSNTWEIYRQLRNQVVRSFGAILAIINAHGIQSYNRIKIQSWIIKLLLYTGWNLSWKFQDKVALFQRAHVI